MRVSHIITRLIVGGAQENTVSSVLGLKHKPGVEVTLISGPSSGPEGSLEPLVRNPGLLQIVPSLIRPVHPVSDWRALRQLTATLARIQPEIVHTHSGKAGILGRIAAARAGVPIVIHTIHGPSFGRFQGAIPNLLFTAAERYAARVTNHFVVVADAMREQYLAAGIGRPDQYTKVLSGFNLAPFLVARDDAGFRARLNLDVSDVVIGKIARLTNLKGHDDLLAVAPELVRLNPRLKFLLVGDGERRDEFERRAHRLGLEKHFVFTGLVAPSEVPSYIGLMDVVVHLSSREGLPRALPQALAAGKPVIAYDCDGAREVCLPGITGFLAACGDLTTLKTRLLELAASPALRESLGSRGREFVRTRFSAETMVEALYALYLDLLDRRGIGNRQQTATPRPAVFC